MADWQSTIVVDGVKISASGYVERWYKNRSDKEIAEKLSVSLGHTVGSEEVRSLRRRRGWLKEPWKAGTPRIEKQIEGTLKEEVLKHLSDRPIGINLLSQLVDRSVMTIESVVEELQKEGYGIVISDEEVGLSECVVDDAHNRVSLPVEIDGGNWFKYGVISDTQIGSVWEQPTALDTFIRWAYLQGVRLIFHAGDISDGVSVYKGHWLNVFARTFDEQEWLIDQRFPKLDGLHYITIGGNHDYTWFKQYGRHIMAHINRPDISWLGYTKGSAILSVGGHEFRVILWHPRGSLGYAKSYRLQRGGVVEIFREFAKKEPKDRLLAILAGHLHIRMSFSEGGVSMMQCGCFQGETSLLEEMGVMPEVGGYIVNMHVDESGFVDAQTEQWRGFEPIEDDWKRWPVYQAAADSMKKVVRLCKQGEGWGG